eukprot:TRINITY_DN6342_c0_g1_i1.p1 TRINITY_DN6342_c0_g1~~TRINITY_DN6342_c0_g1_i1.p1  ORF type:complete len:428 (-),score=124.05 TRINITY_DN6342_c0_g1_i1:89-1372(-)
MAHFFVPILLLAVVAASAHAFSAQPVKSLPSYGAPKQVQYTGYLPANETTGSSLFYWLIECDNNPSSAPLIIWLQGGPGCSSMIGLFNELGPYYVTPSAELVDNVNGWNTIGNVLFIDQPSGTGFSFASNTDELIRDEYEMANDLFTALQKFVQIFPQYKGRPTFISGESYAGKYIPALGTKILKSGSTFSLQLKGLAIGDGWTAPLEQTSVYADQAYNLNLIDWHQKQKVEELYSKCEGLVQNEDWYKAALVCDGVLAYIVNVTGGVNSDDVRLFSDDSNSAAITAYLNRPEVRQAIGVDVHQPFVVCNRTVQTFVRTDEMKPTKQLLPALLDAYQMLLYNGQFDLNVGAPGTEKYLRTLQWPGLEEFLSAQRHVWKVEDKVAGYVKQARSLTYVNVNNAGHMVPSTQPENALDMMSRWITGKPFY